MSIIVVEGPDGSGKSTLLENARLQIPKKYFILVRHSCRPLEPKDISFFLSIIALGNTGGLPLLIDRHPLISEPIYGPILRGSDLTEQGFFWNGAGKTKYLKSTVERIIYCRPPEETIKRNLERNPQLTGVKLKIDQLIRAYDERMLELRQAGVPVFYYDYTLPELTLESLLFGGQPWSPK